MLVGVYFVEVNQSTRRRVADFLSEMTRMCTHLLEGNTRASDLLLNSL